MRFFAKYNEIEFLSDDFSRLYSEEYTLQQLEECLNDQDQNIAYYANKMYDSYKIKKLHYENRKPEYESLEDILTGIENINIPHQYLFITKLIKRMMDLCNGRYSIDYFSDLGQEQWNESEESFNDNPLTFSELFIFSWGAISSEKHDIDFIEKDIIESANDWSGNYGTACFNFDFKAGQTTVNEFIKTRTDIQDYFTELTTVCEELYQLRNRIYFEQINNNYELFQNI